MRVVTRGHRGSRPTAERRGDDQPDNERHGGRTLPVRVVGSAGWATASSPTTSTPRSPPTALLPPHGEFPGAGALGSAPTTSTNSSPRSGSTRLASWRVGVLGSLRRLPGSPFLQLSRSRSLRGAPASKGHRAIAERELNGPVTGMAAGVPRRPRRAGPRVHRARRRRRAAPRCRPGVQAPLLYKHACEGSYGAPEYGGNRDLAGWRAIRFEGDVQPRLHRRRGQRPCLTSTPTSW